MVMKINPMRIIFPLAILYILFGIGSLLSFLMFSTFGMMSNELSARSFLYYLSSRGLALLNGVICLLLFYSFVKLKNWGRHLAIIYNILWLLATVVIVLTALITDPKELVRPGALGLLLFIIAIISIIKFFYVLMSKN